MESEAIQFGVRLGYLFGVLSGFALAMLARPWCRAVLRAYRIRSASLPPLPQKGKQGEFFSNEIRADADR